MKNDIVYIYIQIHICMYSFKNSLWKPDVLLYNSASQEFDTTYEVNVNVKENGWCKYGPPAIFESTCKVSSQHRTKINQQKRFNIQVTKMNPDLPYILLFRSTLLGFRLMYKVVTLCLGAGRTTTQA